MLFFLAAANGRPLWWSSAIPSVIVAVILLLERGPLRTLDASFSRYNKPITIPLFFLLVATALATYPDPDFVTLQALVLRGVIPFMIYLSLVGVTLRQTDLSLLLSALALGSLVMFSRGALAFYWEWGFPDLQTALWARYDVERMSSYEDATLGNVNHMGCYIVLVLPALVLAAISHATRLGRIELLVVVFLGLVNLILSGSRTGMVATLFALVLTAFSHGLRRAGVAILALFVGCVIAFPDLGGSLIDDELIERFVPSVGALSVDASAEERYESILIGWQVFLDHPIFGVGPDMSPDYNVSSIPHESLVHVLSEVGFVGGLSFLFLNVLVIARACTSALRAKRRNQEIWRLLWLIGPACWLLFGLIGGIIFNSSVALLWVGIAHAMLALAGATILQQPNTPR